MEKGGEANKKRWISVDALLKQKSAEEIDDLTDPRSINEWNGKKPKTIREVPKLRDSFIKAAKDSLKQQSGK